jgi:hypothetical protein
MKKFSQSRVTFYWFRSCGFGRLIILSSQPFPRKIEYKSSNLFDHTLSLLRDIDPRARMGLTSDQFAAWIVSEYIHILDYPYGGSGGTHSLLPWEG